MIDVDATFQTSPNALFESFDNEIIIINMLSGSYYSLDATALGIWNLVQARHPVRSVIAATQNAYTGNADTIGSAVTALIEELEGEGLLDRVSEADASAAAAAVPAANEARLDARPPFQAPVVSKFTDMEEMLLLDPIHEVDDTGWPRAKPALEAGAFQAGSLQAGVPAGAQRDTSG